MDLCFIVDGLPQKRGNQPKEPPKQSLQDQSLNNDTHIREDSLQDKGQMNTILPSPIDDRPVDLNGPAGQQSLENSNQNIQDSQHKIPSSYNAVPGAIRRDNNILAPVTLMHSPPTAADAISMQRTNSKSVVLPSIKPLQDVVPASPYKVSQASPSRIGEPQSLGARLQPSSNGVSNNIIVPAVPRPTPLHPAVRLQPPTLPLPMVPPPQSGLLPSVGDLNLAANSATVHKEPEVTEGLPPPGQRIVVMETKFHHKAHMDSKTKQYACRHCGRTFLRRSDFVRHFQIHVGVKPNLCSICGKAFIQRSALTVHIRVHTGEKPYTCGTCGRLFSDSSSLARHRRIHMRREEEQKQRLNSGTVEEVDLAARHNENRAISGTSNGTGTSNGNPPAKKPGKAKKKNRQDRRQ